MSDEQIIVVNSWDDVTSLDLKICDLLENYDMKGSFYPVYNWIDKKISKEDVIKISELHEVGSHTINHYDLKKIPLNVAKKEIIESKKLLENVLEKEITSFVYPMGSYNKAHIKMVQEAEYLCARTTKPFFIHKPQNPYEMHVSIWTYPHAFRDIQALFRLINIIPSVTLNPFRIKNWNIIGKEIFDVVFNNGGVFHFFGHSWQIAENNDWEKLEDLCSHLAYRKNVSYCTVTDCMKNIKCEI